MNELARTLTEYAASFIEGLVHSGVKEVVISPGSRSTPLAMLFVEHQDIQVYMNIDERSASFFALGLAKASDRPVALLCTSGTAAANYFPAVIEASLSRVPLIVLTADRPHELRDIGAPQAIDQLHLFGKYVRWFADMALPESGKEMLKYAKTISDPCCFHGQRSAARSSSCQLSFKGASCSQDGATISLCFTYSTSLCNRRTFDHPI